jgi:hypothetical protein
LNIRQNFDFAGVKIGSRGNGDQEDTGMVSSEGEGEQPRKEEEVSELVREIFGSVEK